MSKIIDKAKKTPGKWVQSGKKRPKAAIWQPWIKIQIRPVVNDKGAVIYWCDVYRSRFRSKDRGKIVSSGKSTGFGQDLKGATKFG